MTDFQQDEVIIALDSKLNILRKTEYKAGHIINIYMIQGSPNSHRQIFGLMLNVFMKQ